jgi:hypothetical protein
MADSTPDCQFGVEAIIAGESLHPLILPEITVAEIVR